MPLKVGDVILLSILSERGPCTVAALAAAVGARPGHLDPWLGSLKARGLVEETPAASGGSHWALSPRVDAERLPKFHNVGGAGTVAVFRVEAKACAATVVETGHPCPMPALKGDFCLAHDPSSLVEA